VKGLNDIPDVAHLTQAQLAENVSNDIGLNTTKYFH
jgi:hypothetical protein